jgi:hypothetical protein
LELHNGAGALIASNDDWQDTVIGGIITTDQVTEVQDSGLLPGHAYESAIMATLPPGNYTAIVRGYSNTTGVALAEVYDLRPIDLLAGSIDYNGSYPDTSMVSYTDHGRTVHVIAYPGQVIVFFNTPINDGEAQNLIAANGGTVLAKIPVIGYYLVRVPSSEEALFISRLRQDTRVNTALPHPAGVRGAKVLILEGCGDTHDRLVQDALINNGGSVRTCTNIADNLNQINTGMTVRAIIGEGNLNALGTHLMNLSSYGAPGNGVNWAALNPVDQQNFKDSYYTFLRANLGAIAALPPEYRENLVITMCAGNNNMPITDVLARLRQDPRIANVLRNNVLIVSTTLMRNPPANFSTTDHDVAIRDNPEAIRGTSLAAPGAMAVIQNVISVTGVSARRALQAAKEAVNANPNHKLIQSEAIDRARARPTPTPTATATATPRPTATATATATPTATPSCIFNGSYTGSYSGTYSGSVAFTVSNCHITVTQPIGGSGAINNNGGATFGGGGGGGLAYTFNGNFSVLPNGSAVASGTWSATYNGTPQGSGTWSASRPP